MLIAYLLISIFELDLGENGQGRHEGALTAGAKNSTKKFGHWVTFLG